MAFLQLPEHKLLVQLHWKEPRVERESCGPRVQAREELRVGVDDKGLRSSQLTSAREERSQSAQGCEPGSFFLAEKVGECPRKRLECGNRVPNPCKTDFNCDAHFKCCPFSCGNVCIDPYEGTGIQAGGRKLAKQSFQMAGPDASD